MSMSVETRPLNCLKRAFFSPYLQKLARLRANLTSLQSRCIVLLDLMFDVA